MKVTVYRPRDSVGLGAPRAFLGDDHPMEGDWVQSAKSIQPDGVDRRTMLHQVGRDFLIYSMYHAREPRYLGYAVENFGAACEAFGYSLPLTEREATWLPYGDEGLDPGTPADLQFLLSSIARVFGLAAAREQARAINITWPSRITPFTSNERGY